MKTMYVAFETNGPDQFFLGIFAELKDAAEAARADRNHLGRYERSYTTHNVWQVSVHDEVNDKESYFDAVEEDNSIGDGVDAWIVYSTDELIKLADDLDWDPTDKEDTMDSLRTNWEEKMTEDQIEVVYDELVKNWEENHGEDEE